MRALNLTMLLLGATAVGCGRDGEPADATAVVASPNAPVTESVAESDVVEAVFPQYGAAPIVDGFCDPNRIVYDDAYLQAYARRNLTICCGSADYEVVVPKFSIAIVFGGLDDRALGHRFRIEDLIRFLETRRNNPHLEQVFPVRSRELLRKIREDEYGWDPWLVHLRCALSIVGGTAYEPAIPIVAALAKNDPDPRIRAGAVMALGRFAHAYPQALWTLQEISADPARREEATVGLSMAKNEASCPRLMAKPLDQPNAKYEWLPVRNIGRPNNVDVQ